MGITDVARVLAEFEKTNNLRIEIRARSCTKRGVADVDLTLVASSATGEIGDQPPLASVQLTCLATNLRTVEAALIHGLYALDFQLAVHELQEEGLLS